MLAADSTRFRAQQVYAVCATAGGLEEPVPAVESCEFLAGGSWPCAGSLVGRYGHLSWKSMSYDSEILPTGFTSHILVPSDSRARGWRAFLCSHSNGSVLSHQGLQIFCVAIMFYGGAGIGDGIGFKGSGEAYSIWCWGGGIYIILWCDDPPSKCPSAADMLLPPSRSLCASSQPHLRCLWGVLVLDAAGGDATLRRFGGSRHPRPEALNNGETTILELANGAQASSHRSRI